MNMLKNEKSPYLLSHATNPVNWYPWCEEAFKKARLEDKPIFLSIGYSSCHWCHVMAQESFEDEMVARVLNRDYVAIKVDREKRPDIDSVYSAVCMALSGVSGWPMNIIMTPEQKPFFAGTYIPRETIGDKIGIIALLEALSMKWKTERDELLNTAEQVTAYIQTEKKLGFKNINDQLLKDACAQLEASFDDEYGGFGKGMKFPMVHDLLFLLRYAHYNSDKNARHMADFSLQQMYRGGIYDHIGGGFCRYSSGREWLVPHFEKTLYDNALLAIAYTEAWDDGHYALYRSVAEATLDYCLRELQAPNGGFYASQDADSNGIEGAYYTFTPEELAKALGENEGRHFGECYDIIKEPNFGEKSIPNLLLNQRWTMLPEGYDELREKLRLFRAARMPIAVDKKQLFSWNALMLIALSKAYLAFGDRRYLSAADKLQKLLKSFEGFSLCIGGAYRGVSSLEDWAFYAIALTEHYKISFDAEELVKAKQVADIITQNFADKAAYFDTSIKAEKLIIRPKTVYDNAIPSGNSAVAVLFARLYQLSGESRFKELLDKQLRFITAYVEAYPAGCGYALTALMSRVYSSRALVCVCKEEIPSALYAVTDKYAPELSVLVKTEENAEKLAEFAPFIAEMTLLDGKAAFYVCSNNTCLPPIAVE